VIHPPPRQGPTATPMTEREDASIGDGRPVGLRRQPIQRRSRERVRLILSAAAQLLDEGGYDALTTSTVAERAGVSVGSIYQFFSNVEAIVTELVREWVQNFDQIMDRLDELDDAPMDSAVEMIIDAYVRFLRETPGFGVVYFATGLTGDARSLDRASNDSLSGRLAAFWARRYGIEPNPRITVIAQVTIQMGDALLAMAFRRAHRGDETIIGETKRALRIYVTHSLAELGLE